MKKLVIYFLATLMFSSAFTYASDIQSLINDTQRIVQKDKTLNLVWWIPVEYWEVSLKEDKTLTEEQIKGFVEALEDYTTFAVVVGESGVFGGMKFEPRDQILKNTELKVGEETLRPLNKEDMNADAQAFFTMMKPLMAQMLGQFGRGMEFVAYPNKKNGKLIIDPKLQGGFTYTCYDNKHKWRLPLGSLLPPMIDETSGEVFPGNYNFNPFTGAKLIRKP